MYTIFLLLIILEKIKSKFEIKQTFMMNYKDVNNI